MAEPCYRLEDGESEINLSRAQCVDTPFGVVIPKLLVKVMEHLWIEEFART